MQHSSRMLLQCRMTKLIKMTKQGCDWFEYQNAVSTMCVQYSLFMDELEGIKALSWTGTGKAE